MAGYYHGGSEIQGEGLQTLYLMNPGYVGYSSDALAGASATGAGNMVFLNAAGNPIPPGNLSHLQQQNSPFVGFPLQATVASSPPPPQDMNRPPGGRHDTSVVHGFAPRLHYNLWTSMDSSTGASVPAAHQAIQAEAIASQFGLRRGGGPAQQQQGLSLSLSPQQPAYSSYRSGNEIPAPPAAISPGSGGGDDARVSGSTSSNSGVSNGIAGIQGVLMGSKYLKSAQELLEEVVNVGNGIKDEKMKGSKAPANANNDQVTAPENSGGDPSGKQSTELTTAERQELQMKKAKLVNMLDEVEQRYRQYHQQMQIVVAAFEAAAGPRSARTYTSLALQTISRQFRCLRDAITGQIKAARRSLGEDVEGQAAHGGGTGGSSRLRAVEQQQRQQRALQQLGMIQPHAWRPQRGLPERSVSVLRAWLFEHFLHPYPKDSDKLMLAKQTGLTRSQVSNWFINARVRLWKPMVEEMYTEEVKEQERSGGSEGKVGKSEAGEEPTPKSTSVAPPPESNIPSNVEHMNHLKSNIDSDHTMGQPSCFALLGDSSDAPSVAFHGEEEEMVQGGSKKMKNAFHDQFHHTISLMGSGGMELKPNGVGGGDHEQFCGRRPNGFSLIDASGDQGGGGFGAYQNYMDQFAPRFTGNGVSLSLGLPHCENGLSLAVAGGPPNFLSGQGIQMGRRIDQIENEENDFCNMGATSSAATQSASAFENINIQNRKRFAAQLLPDFVV